jgi:hypothetical protein
MADLWSPEKITFSDKEACAKRELDMRRRVYPRRVADGKMKQTDADRETEVMEAIYEDYRKSAALEVSGRNRPR